MRLSRNDDHKARHYIIEGQLTKKQYIRLRESKDTAIFNRFVW